MSVEVQADQIEYIVGVKGDSDADSSMLLKFKDTTKPVVHINRTTATKKFADKIVNYLATDVKSKQGEESVDLNQPAERSVDLPVSVQQAPHLNEAKKEMDLS